MAFLNGFEFPTFCDEENEHQLLKAREIDKLAFSTAATIAGLIPILISIQRLPTASIHELVLRNYIVIALLTAGLTLGLPVVQESTRGAVNASEYLREDFSRNEYDYTGQPQTRRRRWNEYIFNGIFTVLQLSLVVLPTLLSHLTLKSRVRTIWGCHGSPHTLWHVGFFLPIPVVGFVWYSFLRWTHDTAPDDKTNEQLVVYRRRHWMQWVDPFANLLPGLAQMFMTVYFTFLFSTIYGLSVKAALVRVMMVPILLFLSRGMSLWFARAASERHPKLLVRCETEEEVERVLNRWAMRQHPDTRQDGLVGAV